LSEFLFIAVDAENTVFVRPNNSMKHTINNNFFCIVLSHISKEGVIPSYDSIASFLYYYDILPLNT
jgi:hypothetical protein